MLQADEEAPIFRLTDDCFTEIFNKLSIQDFEQLRKVCRHFEQMVILSWGLKVRKWRRIGPDTGIFKWRVQNILGHLEELDLDLLTDEELKLLKEYEFFKVKTLKARIDIELKPSKKKKKKTPALNEASSMQATPQLSLEKTQIIAQTFPNLQTLSLEGEIDLIQITKMKNLKELVLYFYRSDRVHRFEEIFTHMKLRKLSLGFIDRLAFSYLHEDFQTITRCTTLEELSLRAEHLNLILPDLICFPHLKKLGCFVEAQDEFWGTRRQVISDRDAIAFGGVVCMYANRLDTFSVGELWENHNTDMFWQMLARARNLRRLQFRKFTCRLREPSEFAVEFANLRELEFLTYSPSYDKFKKFLLFNVISAAKKLEILSVPCEWIDCVFDVDSLLELLTQMQSDREKPLELRCMQLTIDREELDEEEPFTNDCDYGILKVIYTKYPKHKYDMYHHSKYSFECTLLEASDEIVEEQHAQAFEFGDAWY